MHTASQSDSSFIKRHEKITTTVWSDQSDSRFTAGSLSLIVCVCRIITTSAFQIDRSTAASVPDSIKLSRRESGYARLHLHVDDIPSSGNLQSSALVQLVS